MEEGNENNEIAFILPNKIPSSITTEADDDTLKTKRVDDAPPQNVEMTRYISSIPSPFSAARRTRQTPSVASSNQNGTESDAASAYENDTMLYKHRHVGSSRSSTYQQHTSIPEHGHVRRIDLLNTTSRETRSSSNTSVCAITLEPFINIPPENVFKLPCGHRFDIHAIVENENQGRNECPQCRTLYNMDELGASKSLARNMPSHTLSKALSDYLKKGRHVRESIIEGGNQRRDSPPIHPTQPPRRRPIHMNHMLTADEEHSSSRDKRRKRKGFENVGFDLAASLIFLLMIVVVVFDKAKHIVVQEGDALHGLRDTWNAASAIYHNSVGIFVLWMFVWSYIAYVRFQQRFVLYADIVKKLPTLRPIPSEALTDIDSIAHVIAINEYIGYDMPPTSERSTSFRGAVYAESPYITAFYYISIAAMNILFFIILGLVHFGTTRIVLSALYILLVAHTFFVQKHVTTNDFNSVKNIIIKIMHHNHDHGHAPSYVLSPV